MKSDIFVTQFTNVNHQLVPTTTTAAAASIVNNYTVSQKHNNKGLAANLLWSPK